MFFKVKTTTRMTACTGLSSSTRNERIPEALREVQIFSKSQRKTYTLEDVKGQQIGRVQHFLNIPLHGLLRCGKITRIEG